MVSRLRAALGLAGWLVVTWSDGAAEPPAGGTLVGTVRVAPPFPAPAFVENTTDPHVCGRVHRLDDLAVSAEGGLAQAIVALEDAPRGWQGLPAPSRLVLDNRQCRFIPRVAAVTVGSTLEVVNSDPTLHTVHLYGPMEINLALPLQGMRLARRLDRPGIIVIKCDVHGWMQAFVRVDSHPFHAVTDESGSFRIDAVPPGEHTLSVWHETLGTLTRRARVKAGETVRVDVTYETVRSVRPPG